MMPTRQARSPPVIAAGFHSASPANAPLINKPVASKAAASIKQCFDCIRNLDPISPPCPLFFLLLCDVFDRLDLCYLLGTNGCLLCNPGIDKQKRLAHALYIQRAMLYVFGNEDITGQIDLYDLVAERKFNIRIEVGEVFGFPDEVNPLIMRVDR